LPEGQFYGFYGVLRGSTGFCEVRFCQVRFCHVRSCQARLCGFGSAGSAAPTGRDHCRAVAVYGFLSCSRIGWCTERGFLERHHVEPFAAGGGLALAVT
jgi:hypothetical protein